MNSLRIALFLIIFSLLPFAAVFAATAEQIPSAAPVPPAELEALKSKGAELQYLGEDRGVDGWIVLMPIAKKEAAPAAKADNTNNDDAIKALQESLNQISDGQAPTTETPTTLALPEVPTAKAETRKPPSAAALKLWSGVEKTNWVQWGNSDAPYIYALIDPFCPFSQKFMQDVQTKNWISGNRVQVRLIPVGYVKKESLDVAATLLNTTDVNSWANRMAAGTPAGDKSQKVEKSARKKVEKNFDTVAGFHFDATPFIVYKTGGGEIKIIRGKPDTLYAIEADLLETTR
ncbi:MAG: hypothetical protein GC136_02250 [Alphaproteobacteria bacterium]|nr:hypothetical protein [Alphaproteobacteria bacterium]